MDDTEEMDRGGEVLKQPGDKETKDVIGEVAEGLAVLAESVATGMTSKGEKVAAGLGGIANDVEASPKTEIERAVEIVSGEMNGESQTKRNAEAWTESEPAWEKIDKDFVKEPARVADDAYDEQFKYRTQDLSRMAEIWAETEYALAGNTILGADGGATIGDVVGAEVARDFVEQGFIADRGDEEQIGGADQAMASIGEEPAAGEPRAEWEEAYRALLRAKISEENPPESTVGSGVEMKRHGHGAGRSAARLVGSKSGAADIAQAAEYAQTGGGAVPTTAEGSGQIVDMFREILAEIKKLPHGQDRTRFSA